MSATYQSASTARESNESEYIRLCGEKGTESIVGDWLDRAPQRMPDKVKAEIMAHVQVLLIRLADPLTIAEWAADVCGNQDYESWLEDQQ